MLRFLLEQRLSFQKIKVGCTAEYLKNANDSISKHCICDSHLCNFHHLISSVNDTRARGTAKQQVSSTNWQVFAQIYVSILSFVFCNNE